MSDDIIDLRAVRILGALTYYETTGKIHKDLIDGVITLSNKDITKLANFYTKEPKLKSRLNLLKSKQQFCRNQTMQEIVKIINNQFTVVFEELETFDHRFTFPGIVNKYRQGINPVRALFYELSVMQNKYGAKYCKYNQWLCEYIEDPDFLHDLMTTIRNDIDHLNKFLEWYDEEFCDQLNSSPVAVIHARRMIADFNIILTFFGKIKREVSLRKK